MWHSQFKQNKFLMSQKLVALVILHCVII